MANRNNQYYKLFMCLLAVFMVSCEKLDESGFLDVPYAHIADMKEYCHGACEETYGWENFEVGVQGHIPGITNAETMQEYKTASRFFLSDIRNGMILEIKVQDGLHDIFDSLNKLQKTDKLFIKGFARPILTSDGTKCEKGVFIDIYGLDNIKVNIQ